jgi:hypothetical protein
VPANDTSSDYSVDADHSDGSDENDSPDSYDNDASSEPQTMLMIPTALKVLVMMIT